MADNSRREASHDFHRVSRKAEEASLRRYQAVHWLECVVGPLGLPSEPSEIEFISCLRNGIILCNVINKIQPGTISKVVNNHVTLESESAWDARPLPAYQYFENVRNFLVAIEELKLPGFEASDLERENFEAGSAGRIADCVLALKSYHEWKEWSGGKGVYKHVTVKSPLVLHSHSKNFSRPPNTEASQPCRQIDMSAVDNKQSLTESLVKALSQHMVDSKENMNSSFLTSIQKGNQGPDDPVQVFSEILTRCLEEKLGKKFPVLNAQETSEKTGALHTQKPSILTENLSMKNKSQRSRAQSRKCSSHHLSTLLSQEKDLKDIKALWSETKRDFEGLQNQLVKDLNHVGSLIEEMADPARGYQRVIQENRKLYNMVQDLKGNIRVYCRIRPMLNAEAKNAISFQAEDGTLVVSDPSNEQRNDFQFNRVYGPMATQEELFKDARPLIRSVMDGYNVCILAYGQTGSGKTYTMYGPSGSSEKEMGINFFALNDLFQTVSKRKGTMTYELHVQMVEICNEQIRDLLAEVSACQEGSSLPNVTSHAVNSYIEAINLVKLGEVRRTGDSSRATTNLCDSSHSIVTIHVQGKDLSGNILRSRLHFVDLAGNGEDDKSLSCLEDVMTSLSQKNPCIHYRDSKLTSLLQGAFGGKAKILVFAHVIPEGESFTKTVSTLRFAQRISTIELGAAQSNKTNSEVMELKNEIEILQSALGDKTASRPSTPQPNKQPKSPCEKPGVMPQKSPVRSRRLSMEDNRSTKTNLLPKSPIGKPKLTTDTTPPRSTRTNILPKSPIGRPKLTTDKTPPRPRRLSIENPMIGRSEKSQKMKEPKSPYEGKKGTVTKLTPPRTRRLSIENPSSVRPGIDNRKGTTAPPQSSLHARRLSMEGPKDKKKEIPNSADVKVSSNSYTSMIDVPKTPPSSYQNGPTYTDCAAKFPPKTPDQEIHYQHSGVNTLAESQTPGIAKSTNGKRSQIKKSLRTIGKLINGSDKRHQQKLESTSTKGKDVAERAKSPPSSKARVLRRQSLTSLPPPGSIRRTSLGGMSTDARPIDNRNAKTPPSVRSSTNSAKRWM